MFTVIVWLGLLRSHRFGHLRRGVVVRVARLVVADVQVPVPLVIVNVAPVFEQAPALEKVTGLPEAPPVAATPKLVLKTALAGACVVTLIVWAAFCAVTDSVTCGAAL